MKKLEIEKNFHVPLGFIRSCTYKSLFNYREVADAFTWNSVGLDDHFLLYYHGVCNKKEAKVGILKVFACAPED